MITQRKFLTGTPTGANFFVNQDTYPGAVYSFSDKYIEINENHPELDSGLLGAYLRPASTRYKKYNGFWYDKKQSLLDGIEDDYAGLYFHKVTAHTSDFLYVDEKYYTHYIFPSDRYVNTEQPGLALTQYNPTSINVNTIIESSKACTIQVTANNGSTPKTAILSLQGITIPILVPANTTKENIAVLIAAAVNDGIGLEKKDEQLIVPENLVTNIDSVIENVYRLDGTTNVAPINRDGHTNSNWIAVNWYNKNRDYISANLNVKRYLSFYGKLYTSVTGDSVTITSTTTADVPLLGYVMITGTGLTFKTPNWGIFFDVGAIPADRKGNFQFRFGQVTLRSFTFESGTQAAFMEAFRLRVESIAGVTARVDNSNTITVTSTSTYSGFTLLSGDTVEMTFPADVSKSLLISVRGLFCKNPTVVSGSSGRTVRISKSTSVPIASPNTLTVNDIILYKFNGVEILMNWAPTNFINGRYVSFPTYTLYGLNQWVDYVLMEGVLYNFNNRTGIPTDIELVGINQDFQLELNNNFSKITRVIFRMTGTYTTMPYRYQKKGIPTGVLNSFSIEHFWNTTNGLSLYNGVAEKCTSYEDFYKDFSTAFANRTIFDPAVDPISQNAVCNQIKLFY
jgi:hypothetical protein